MESNSEIKLVQSPVIAHALTVVGQQVTERLNGLNIDNLVPTEDSVKRLKELRADLNKELDNYEAQRKFIKEGVMNPYNDFEAIYKVEISEKYKGAIDKLKDKIALVENKIKEAKKTAVKTYFEELCKSHELDFLTFEHTGIEVNISTSENKYKETCAALVSQALSDLELIKTQDNQVEILAEYKQTRNVSQAIMAIKTRKEREAAEAAKIAPQPAAQPAPAPTPQPQPATPPPPAPAPNAEIFTASLKVTGTMEQLQAVVAFMKQNNILYINL